MTRINAKAKAAFLPDKLLSREINEIVRPLNKAIKRAEANNLAKNIPTFRLGVGHEMFFFNRIKFLNDRFLDLQDEYELRFGVYFGSIGENMAKFDHVKLNYPKIYGDWIATEDEISEANAILLERLLEKSENYAESTFRYKRKSVDREEFVNLLIKSCEC